MQIGGFGYLHKNMCLNYLQARILIKQYDVYRRALLTSQQVPELLHSLLAPLRGLPKFLQGALLEDIPNLYVLKPQGILPHTYGQLGLHTTGVLACESTGTGTELH